MRSLRILGTYITYHLQCRYLLGYLSTQVPDFVLEGLTVEMVQASGGAASPRCPGADRCRCPLYNTHLGCHEKSKTNLQTAVNHYFHDINLLAPSQPQRKWPTLSPSVLANSSGIPCLLAFVALLFLPLLSFPCFWRRLTDVGFTEADGRVSSPLDVP